MADKKTTCIYCGSNSYGYGCPYSPHKKHVHLANNEKCIYCGSKSLGVGCPNNPFGKSHLRGAENSTMTKESIYNSVLAGVLLHRLTQPIKETEEYKKGIINEKGSKIRELNEDEKHLYTLLDSIIIKAKRLIGEDILDLLRNKTLLEASTTPLNESFDKDRFMKETELNSEIKFNVEKLTECYNKGIDMGFSKDYIENQIFKSIINIDENQD